MSSFHEQTFATRHGQMGDQAEAACEAVYNGRLHRLGLNRIWLNGKNLTLRYMTLGQRYTPDFLALDAFVECMGIGRDQTLKIKTEKLDALRDWDEYIGPVRLFVYDSKNGRYWDDQVDNWNQQICQHASRGTFSEGKPYHALLADFFPCEPLSLPEGAVL